MDDNHYKPGEMFRRFYLQNVEKNSFSEENTEEVDSASDNLSVEAELLKYLKEHKVKCDFKRNPCRTCRRCTQRYADA